MDDEENEMTQTEIKDIRNNYEIEYIGNKFSKELKIYKVIVLGDIQSKKIQIISRLLKRDFSPTISFDIVNCLIKINNKIIQFQLWDACPHQEFAKSVPNLFKNASIAIIAYSLNYRSSFENVISW